MARGYDNQVSRRRDIASKAKKQKRIRNEESGRGPLLWTKALKMPEIDLAVSDATESSDADNRVVDVLRKLVADRLADFHVGLADKIVGCRKPAEVRHSLQVPDDDAWL